MPDDIKLPDVMSMVRALEHTQRPARPIALEMIERCIEDYARAAAERATITEDMKSAVRWAPSSAHWSERLREFFGPDAREGITALERQLREARAAVEAERARRVPLTDEQIKDLCLKAGSEASPDVPLYVVVSRAIEAAHGIPAPKGGLS